MNQILNLNFKIKKLYLVIGLIVIAVIAAGLILWKTGVFTKLANKIFAAQVQVVVKEAGTEKILKSAEVQIGTQKTTTNDQGVANLINLRSGKRDLEINIKPYKYYKQQVKLHRGKNDLGTVHMQLVEAQVNGQVLNYISEVPVSDVTVTVDQQKATTDKDGKYTLKKVPGGKYSLEAKKDGYLVASSDVEINNEIIAAPNLNLVPEGMVVFVSNRDQGKRGIYRANYDGSNQAPLIQRVGDYEDYSPQISPHQTKVAFISTRSGSKSANNNLIGALYLINIDGTALKDISDDPNINNVRWSPDGGYVVYQSKKDGEKNSALRVYNVLSGETSTVTDPQAGGYPGAYLVSPNDNKIVYSFYFNANPSEAGIYLADINGNNKQKIYDKTGSPISFSSNGAVIKFSVYDSGTKWFSYNLNSSELASIDMSSDKTLQSVKSPDTSKLAFIDYRDGKSNVYLADSNFQNEKVLTDNNASNWPVECSKDGNYILFNVSKPGESARYIVSIDGNKKAKKIVDVYDAGGGY